MKSPLKILLVEDEAMIAMCMRMQLENAGYEVCQTVATGDEAIAAARQKEANIILMDIRLAGDLDGIDAACRIKEFWDAPIIFITGYTDSGLRERARQVDPLDFFVKPVNIRQLISVIENFFQNRPE